MSEWRKRLFNFGYRWQRYTRVCYYFSNSGTFTDNIGRVNQVKVSIAPGDTLLISCPSISGTTEITPGGTTTLTAAGVSDWQQQGANNGGSLTYSYYW